CPEPQYRAPAREVVETERGHRGGGWGAGRELGDAGAQLDAPGVRPPPGQRGEGVGTVGLRGPHRLVAEPLCGADGLQRAGWWHLLPVARCVTDAHAPSLASMSTVAEVSVAAVASA